MIFPQNHIATVVTTYSDSKLRAIMTYFSNFFLYYGYWEHLKKSNSSTANNFLKELPSVAQYALIGSAD